jgi:L-Ala-D/L-Glu epimerase
MKLTTHSIDWPLYSPFRIASGVQSSVPAIWAILTDQAGNQGRGEAQGVDYFGETPASMLGQIHEVAGAVERGELDRYGLQEALPAGGARNALDCAFWDLKAKQGDSIWGAAGPFGASSPNSCALTVGIDALSHFPSRIDHYRHHRLLKVKTDGEHGIDPVRIVHEHAPMAQLIVDPNCGWTPKQLEKFAPMLRSLNVGWLEQPITPEEDCALAHITHDVPIIADEACQNLHSLNRLWNLYDGFNIKLDKTGGLTEAIAMVHEIKRREKLVMIGCMLGSSLAMAPAFVLATAADVVDLDGPLLQSADAIPPIDYRSGMMSVPSTVLWG